MATPTNTKARNAAARAGTHWLAHQPGQPLRAYRVVAVRDDRVRLQSVDDPAESWWANATTSAAIFAGEHRRPPLRLVSSR